MSEDAGTPAPSSGAPAASAPGGADVAAGSTAASAVTGNAPGGGGDAVAADQTAPQASPTSPAKFRLLDREFTDQKHAEQVLKSELTRARQREREFSEAQNQINQYKAELDALRSVVAKQPSQVPGQVVPKGSSGMPNGPGSFARELAENGELELIAKIFSDPEMGPAHAMYRMAEVMDEKYSRALSDMKQEIHGELSQRDLTARQHQAVAQAIGVSRSLISDYPEFDENNQSEEAVQAQNGIVEILKALPQVPGPDGNMVSMASVWLASNPEQALRWAADTYRRSYGTPIFAQTPGTSGSPSAKAAQAAEAAAAGAVATPLDGSGVPRQRSNGQAETPLERIKRENREFGKKIAKTPSGRPLGFEVS